MSKKVDKGDFLMLKEFSIDTQKEGIYDITKEVKEAIRESKIKDGIAIIFCPHTSSAITINENADPHVLHDLLLGMNLAYPERKEFKHSELNSHAHLKSGTFGCDQTIIIKDGFPILGTWQSIMFCEFDGPRTRKYYIKVIAG